MWILKPGDLFDNRYRIQREIGSGGMSYVYAASDEELNEVVALKIIRPELVGDEEMVERFKREVRIARQLHHPNIIRIFEFGHTSVQDRRIYYLTMELLSGLDLGAWLSRRSIISLAEAMGIGVQLCDALEQAHRCGVIHRDIKPQNIFIDERGQAKLMDFGISRLTTLTGLTRGSQFLGTPKYMSPEQVSGSVELDQRSDLYSLGVVLYELCTRRVPFGGQTPIEVALRHIQDVPEPPRRINSQMPEDLETIVLTCLEKKPAARYGSARELREALQKIRLEEDEETQYLPSSAKTPPAAQVVSTPAESGPAFPEPRPNKMETAPVRTPQPFPGSTTRKRVPVGDSLPGFWRGSWGKVALVGMGALAALVLLFGYLERPAPPEVSRSVMETEASTFRQEPDGTSGEPTDGAEAPGPPTPAQESKPTVDKSSAVPKEAVPPGFARIAANPGTRIYIDGELAGTIPPVIGRKLAAGRHRIRYEIPDYEKFEEVIEIEPGEEQDFSHRFPLFGALRVVCQPYAAVRLDGKEMGFTPLHIPRVREGDHRLVLFREGFRTIEESVIIRAGEVNLFQFSLAQQNEDSFLGR